MGDGGAHNNGLGHGGPGSTFPCTGCLDTKDSPDYGGRGPSPPAPSVSPDARLPCDLEQEEEPLPPTGNTAIDDRRQLCRERRQLSRRDYTALMGHPKAVEVLAAYNISRTSSFNWLHVSNFEPGWQDMLMVRCGSGLQCV